MKKLKRDLLFVIPIFLFGALLVGCNNNAGGNIQEEDSTHEVTFTNQNGLAVHTINVDHGGTVDAGQFAQAVDLVEPTLGEGWQFVSWNLSSSTSIVADTVFAAVVKVGVYEVHFLQGNGAIMETTTVVYGEDAKLPTTIPTPLIGGLVFLGWNDAYRNITKETYVYSVFSGTSVVTDIDTGYKYYVRPDGILFAGFNPLLGGPSHVIPAGFKVPSHLNGVPVIGIGPGAFLGCEFYYSEFDCLPDSIIYIGVAAFKNTYYYNWHDDYYEPGSGRGEALKFPSNLKEIAPQAFYGATFSWTSLAFDALPDSVEFIGEFAFSNVNGMYSPDSPGEKYQFYVDAVWNVSPNLKKIGRSAFSNSCIYDTINFNNSTITTIPEEAFDRHYSLETVLMADSNITNIEFGAFMNAFCILNLTLPKGLLVLGENAFEDAMRKDKLLEANNMWYSYGASYYDHRGASLVVIPSSLKIVPQFAFSNASLLYRLQISEGVEEIEFAAFSRTSIIHIVLPESLREIGNLAFDSAGNEVSGYEEYYELIIPKNVWVVGDHAFEAIQNFEKITISESVQIIGDYAFADAWYVVELDFNPNPLLTPELSNIGNYAFYGSLNEQDPYPIAQINVVLPPKLLYIGPAAFHFGYWIAQDVTRTMDISLIEDATLYSNLLNDAYWSARFEGNGDGSPDTWLRIA